MIAGMKRTKFLASLQHEIDGLRAALAALGPIHPGSVSRQYQVCGRAGCRCQDPKNPQRHGPYPKLTYVHRGRYVCRFVRADLLAELAPRLAAYKEFRRLTNRWVTLSIRQAQTEFFAPAARTPKRKRPKKVGA
jgi:hypothetical protein